MATSINGIPTTYEVWLILLLVISFQSCSHEMKTYNNSRKIEVLQYENCQRKLRQAILL